MVLKTTYQTIQKIRERVQNFIEPYHEYGAIDYIISLHYFNAAQFIASAYSIKKTLGLSAIIHLHLIATVFR